MIEPDVTRLRWMRFIVSMTTSPEEPEIDVPRGRLRFFVRFVHAHTITLKLQALLQWWLSDERSPLGS